MATLGPWLLVRGRSQWIHSSSSKKFKNLIFFSIIIIHFLLIVLYPCTSSERFTYHIITPGTPGHTFATPQRSMQPGHTLQGATGDQCTIALSMHCQVFILWLNRGTFRVQILTRDCRYRRLSVWQDLNPRCRG